MSYPGQYPNYPYFASEFDQPSSSFGYEDGVSFEPHQYDQYDQWTPHTIKHLGTQLLF